VGAGRCENFAQTAKQINNNNNNNKQVHFNSKKTVLTWKLNQLTMQSLLQIYINQNLPKPIFSYKIQLDAVILNLDQKRQTLPPIAPYIGRGKRSTLKFLQPRVQNAKQKRTLR